MNLERNAEDFGREFWAFIFGGCLKPWKNKATKFADKIRDQNSLRNSPAISLKICQARIKKFIPNPLCRASGSTNRKIAIAAISNCSKIAQFEIADFVAQTLHHLCHATAVTLHRCRIFGLMLSQCRTRIALHPLKCLNKGPVAPFGGVVAPKVGHAYIIKSCRATGGVAATVSRVVLHCDTKIAELSSKLQPNLLEISRGST